MKRNHYYLLAFLAAVVAACPGILLRLTGISLSIIKNPDSAVSQVITMTIFAGAAILASSFLLLWACDAAQKDISQTLALAVVALLAVLPEYSVDMYFTWQAGQFPDQQYAHYAIANMTGANRLLIGVAWSLIALLYWFKVKAPVRLGPERRTELFFLGLATLYAFTVPFKGTLTLFDAAVFIGIYIWYIIVASRRPVEEPEVEGPAVLLAELPTTKRRFTTSMIFVFAAGAILANASPFSEGLVESGKLLKINEFLLVQWLAPIASEAPEFIVAIAFALRSQAGLALGSLISSKLNQWTLLVGMIPIVYAISAKTTVTPIPMNSFQMHEILLTAAQSLMAVMILASMRLSISQAALIFLMFIGQFFAPGIVEAYPRLAPFGLEGTNVHQLFSMMYVVIAFGIYLDNPSRLKGLSRGGIILPHHHHDHHGENSDKDEKSDIAD